jgi:hypothetical protein
MTPTATAPRTKDVRAGLDERDKAWAAAEKAASELGTELANKLQRSRALHDERRRLIHREPSLVTHLNEPAKKGNQIDKLDREIAALGDLVDLKAKVEHRRRLAERAKQSWQDYVRANFWEIVESSRAEGEALTTEANQAAMAFAEALTRLLEFQQRLVGYTAPVPGINGHVVPGIEATSNFLRLAESVDLKSPIPQEPA